MNNALRLQVLNTTKLIQDINNQISTRLIANQDFWEQWNVLTQDDPRATLPGRFVNQAVEALNQDAEDQIGLHLLDEADRTLDYLRDTLKAIV